MTAELYIYPEAFTYNGIDSESDIAGKLSALVQDMCYADTLSSDDNVFISTFNILSTNVYKGKTLIDFVNDNLSSDQIGLLYSIIGNTSKETNMTYEEAKERCKYDPNETVVTSLLVLNNNADTNTMRYITFDEYTIVYSRDSLVKLRRQILGNHPGSVDNFLSECRKWFLNLEFHDNCKKSLITDYIYLDIIPRKLVYYLSCLNDGYAEIHKEHQHHDQGINNTLKDFSGKYGLEDVGSRQGNPHEKAKLTFDFVVNGMTKQLYCEPHLKISTPDNGKICNDLRKFNPRIYFYPNYCVDSGIIYVGSMGTHL